MIVIAITIINNHRNSNSNAYSSNNIVDACGQSRVKRCKPQSCLQWSGPSCPTAA